MNARSSLVLLGAVVAFAFVAWFIAMHAADPEVASTVGVPGRASSLVNAIPSEARPGERSALPENDAATAAPAAAMGSVPNDSTLVVEVTDAGGRPVVGATAWLVHGDDRWRDMVAPNGVAAFAWSSSIVDLDKWRVMAVIPGRLVARPLLPFASPNVVAIAMGDVGTLRITCPGAIDVASVDVLAEAEGGFYGSGAACSLGVGESVDVQFAVGRFDARASARIGDLTALMRVPGPRAHGEVVDVVLSLASCRVSGTFARPVSAARGVHAVCIAADGAESHRALVEADECTFSVDLPRRSFEFAYFVCRDEFVALPHTSFDAAEIDVGTLDLAPRPSLGRLEFRDGEGNVRIGCGRVVAATTVSGRRATMPECALWRRETLGRGNEWLGLPAIASILVEADAGGFYATPSSVEVRGGGVFHATLALGARVVVCAMGTDGTRRWRFSLRDTATNRRFEWRGTERVGEGFGSLFEGLPPGDYVVESDDEVAAGSPIRVLAGSEQRVDVVLTNK